MPIDQRKLDAHKCTCHFYKPERVSGNVVPWAFASGVCVEINDNFFVFTARHVVKDGTNNLIIGFGDENGCSLGGKWIENEKYDVAILKLDEESAEIVQTNRQFLSSNELGVNHEIVYNQRYAGIGYPGSMNNNDLCSTDITRVSDPLIYSDFPTSLDVYDTQGCDIKKNIVIPYRRNFLYNMLTGQLVLDVPDPHGMSGGGLWYMPEQLTDNQNNLGKTLVGILNKWVNERYLVATRIDVCTEIVRQIYNIDIEESNLVRFEMQLS